MSKEIKRRNSNTTSLKESFGDLLSNYNLKTKYHQTHLMSSWEEIMGKPIASRTQKMFIKDRKLFVFLSSAPLKQELIYRKQKVMDLLEERFDEKVIDDIAFL